MPWTPYYRGDGRAPSAAPWELPELPPWRRPASDGGHAPFQPPPGLVEAVNAALHLRRPLLLTGEPGSGKSTVIESISAELGLGEPLRWHITSRSTLNDALYRYDVLGRIYAQQLRNERAGTGNTDPDDDIAEFLRLGPLGTALLPGARPRALLIDEFDKCDFDLPGDLLDALERGRFEVPELSRHHQSPVLVKEWDSEDRHEVHRGRIECDNFPVIVITSNGEREFSAPFLRRCVRFRMPQPSPEFLYQVLTAHLGAQVSADAVTGELITAFLERLRAGESVAVDQLLNAVYLLTGAERPSRAEKADLKELLLRELSRA